MDESREALSRAVRPFRHFQARVLAPSGQPLFALIAEIQRLDGAAATLAEHRLPADLLIASPFAGLPDLVPDSPAARQRARNRADALPGIGARRREAQPARASAPATPVASSMRSDHSATSSRVASPAPAPADQPVFSLGDRRRSPDALPGSSHARRADSPAVAGHEQRPRSGSISPAAGSRAEEQRSIPPADRHRDRASANADSGPVGTSESQGGQPGGASPHAGQRQRDHRPVVPDAALPPTVGGSPFAEFAPGSNGWHLLDSLTETLMRESGSGGGVPAAGVPRRSARAGPQNDAGATARRDNPTSPAPTAPPGNGNAAGAGARPAAIHIDEVDAAPVQPPVVADNGGSDSRDALDLDDLVDRLDELLREQARRHGVQLE